MSKDRLRDILDNIPVYVVVSPLDTSCLFKYFVNFELPARVAMTIQCANVVSVVSIRILDEADSQCPLLRREGFSRSSSYVRVRCSSSWTKASLFSSLAVAVA